MMYNETELYCVPSTLHGKRISVYQLATWKNGLPFRKIDFSDKGKPIIKIAELNGGITASTSYTEHEYSRDVFLTKGDLVFSWSGNPDTSIDVYRYSLPDGWLNQHIFKVTANRNFVSTDYLYYILKFLKPNFSMIAKNKQTTGLGHVTIADLQRMSVIVPSFECQDKISGILKAIDDKIENNNAINHNLEQQAQAIFEEWFTSHTTGFKEISLASLMSYAGGSQPPASEFVSNPRKGYVRFVQIRDYDSDGHITYIPISKKNKLCEETDIMIARYGASLGRICYGLNGAYNVALAKVFPKKSYYREFLRCYLSSRDFYEGINYRGGRSAQAGFNESDIRSFTLAFPYDEAIVQKFEDIAYPMFAQRLSLMKESRKLGNLRNSLLPKLLSGEINTLEIEF